ncbi:MAG: hypothetical protein SynsKO_33210 [Synoicihabitans sp.]
MPAQENPQSHRFPSDQPLEHLEEDRLERRGFAERLAADLLSWHGRHSLVVSINGEWGSGKTTLNNFVKEELESKGNPLIVEFNPWQWSGQDRVFEAFFAVVRAEFQSTDQQKETEQLAERWEAFAAWTKLGASISTKLEQVVPPLLGTSLVGALLANSGTTPALQWAGVSVGLVGVVLWGLVTVVPEIAIQFVELVRRDQKTPTLSQLRSEITTQLEKLRKDGRTVLIVIDDIDRLSKEEIRTVFQLVKANADFPNLVYLLLFQKDIVVSALSDVVADRGEEYLKKIVQVEFDLPQAPRSKMTQIFQNDLNWVIERSKPRMHWDKDRIQHLFSDHFFPYFRTLRDVKRFIGTFDFYFNGHINEGVLEVNPIDLLAIEILRTFDHQAYLTVRDSFGFASEGDVFRALLGNEDRAKHLEKMT